MSLSGRPGSVLIAVALAGCQSAGPAATPTSTPGQAGIASPSAAASTAPSASPQRVRRVPLPSAPAVKILIDTDVAPDDLVAIAFLVAAPNVEIAAITVSGTGEVHCPRGVSIVLGLLERPRRAGHPGRLRQRPADRPRPRVPGAVPDNADAAAGLDLPTTARSGASGDAVALITTTAAGPGRRRSAS